jgi:methylated-DNA-[protein]-cysteine S-methyltransferase
MMVAVVVRTPLGWAAAVAAGGELTTLVLPQPSRAAAVAALPAGCDLHGGEEVLEHLAEGLTRYFAGERVDWRRFPVDLSAVSAFHQRALLAAREIPYGEVRSYRWIAARADSPRAARAAGQAMNRNPVPLVIPCHRVVGSRGRLTGFGGGLAMKRALLELEGVRVEGARVVR